MTTEVEAQRRRGPRGPYAKSERTRGAILDAALEVFAQSGYRAGSLRSVAERVGISEAGLLHHFANKSALLAAVLEHRDDQSLERFDFANPDGRVRLRSLVRLAEYNATVPGVVELFCTLSAEATGPDHPAHDYFQARYTQTRGMLADAFAHIAAGGGLRPGVDPARAGMAAIALWDGLQIQWLLDRSELDVADELRAYFDAQLIEPL